MRAILLFGAGKSSYFLIDYLIKNATIQNWQLTICDISQNLISKDFENNSYEFVSIDINNDEERSRLIKGKSIVISMLPAFMHPIIAKDCLKYNVNFASASYQSDEMIAMKDEIESKGLIFLNECGLDPGIDHMSAMEEIDKIQVNGGKIISFRSYCGGLIAPDCIDNPWAYKFTWNPRNVVLAGQGTAKYLENSKLKLLPYQRLFQKTERIEFGNNLIFEGYPNRDSISYKSTYKLDGIKNMIRGTLRMPDFCSAWNLLVNLGITDDSYKIQDSQKMTLKQFTESYLDDSEKQVKEKFCDFFQLNPNDKIVEMIEWLGLFNDEKITDINASPAGILQTILESKWKLNPSDRDLVVMQHIFEFEQEGTLKTKKSNLYLEGETSTKTAMAKTVGLPLAIAVKLILNNKISAKGLLIPVSEEFYNPILSELTKYGIKFRN
jgi:saccharopine dehydrogenase-like NADP-dependent oxidoreductase